MFMAVVGPTTNAVLNGESMEWSSNGAHKKCNALASVIEGWLILEKNAEVEGVRGKKEQG